MFAHDQMEQAAVVLVVEDDLALCAALQQSLATLELPIEFCNTGADALRRVSEQMPTLVVLDLGLPDIDGREVCAGIRRLSWIPIIVLSARVGEADKVALLELGADDYVTKPFSVGELVARVRALLRRAALAGPVPGTPRLIADGVEINIVQRSAVREGVPIRLTPIEWLILEALAKSPGRSLTHRQIFDAVWNRQFGNPQQYLRVYITHLRRKIEPDPTQPRWIVTDPGVGYRLEAE